MKIYELAISSRKGCLRRGKRRGHVIMEASRRSVTWKPTFFIVLDRSKGALGLFMLSFLNLVDSFYFFSLL